MWITSFDSTQHSPDASVDILVDPSTSETDHLAVTRVTLPPGAAMPRHSRGYSDTLIIPLDGELSLVSGDGCVEHLVPCTLATVAAHERISVENHALEPASMLECFAPPTFVETRAGLPARAVNEARC